MLRDRTVGIVGGSGYLGSHLAKALSAENHVRILDVKAPDYLDASRNLSFIGCDITNPGDCVRALAGLDVVFHRAGLYGNLPSMKAPHLYYRVNLLGTHNVLRACVDNNVQRFLFDSTEFVYGCEVSSPVSEDVPARPASIYGATKLACEAAVGMYDSVYGLPSVIFRFCRVRDPGKKDVISSLAGQLLKGEPVTLLQGGRPVMDFVEIQDVTSACIAAAESKIRNEVFNIGPGEGISLNQIVETIKAAANAPDGETSYRDTRSRPPSAEFQFGPEKFYMSVAKAASILGWKPATDLRQSIANTVASLPARAGRNS